MTSSTDYSIVEFLAENEGYACGYCKSSNTNHSHGMWAYTMTVQDYQHLIDRGWRRSGEYCYKPSMNLTCCPQYTIRCEAPNVHLTKSQKTVLKRMNRFLINDWSKTDAEAAINSESDVNSDISGNKVEDNVQLKAKLAEDNLSLRKIPVSITKSINDQVEDAEASMQTDGSTTKCDSNDTNSGNYISAGPDPNKPPCKKAKLLRRERRQQKAQQNNAVDGSSPSKSKGNVPKLIEEYLAEPQSENIHHKLEIRLVRSKPKSSEFTQTLEQSHLVYSKYQQTVHNDPPSKCSMSQFTRFLVNSPLQIKLIRSKPPSDEFEQTRTASFLLYQKYQMIIHNEPDYDCDEINFRNFLVKSPLEPKHTLNGPSCGYGSFHQQYWLDGKLIAVAVIDILPYCVSSVYFYYDPDYKFLSLGTYASLREIAFTRELQNKCPELQYYYMGFYIHSCPKMRYKGQYQPSFLLCPETYNWYPLEKCIPKLDQSKYSRLEENPNKEDTNRCSVETVAVLCNQVAMRYGDYQRATRSNDEQEVKTYSQLVGGICSRNMLLWRK